MTVLPVILTVLLTFVLGGTTFLAFFLADGGFAMRAPAVVWQSWYLIYPLVAFFAAVVGFVLGSVVRARLRVAALSVVVFAGWLGEYVVLASGVLADELNPQNALYYWALATAGPLQPLAALLGAWLARRRRGCSP